MKKLILSLTLIALLTASLGGAAFAQSQQEPLPEVTTETAQGSAPAQADASQSMYPAPGLRPGGPGVPVDQSLLYAQPVRRDG